MFFDLFLVGRSFRFCIDEFSSGLLNNGIEHFSDT
jgi:hypothetical protein